MSKLPYMPGTMGAILQARYMLGVVALVPAVEGLRRDIEVTAGKPGIVAVGSQMQLRKKVS